jgi:hypothetical protein
VVKKILALLTLTCLVVLSPGATFTSAQFPSTFFTSTNMDDAQTIITQSSGDLWPSCWADDDNLYAANGDGKGFSLSDTRGDVVVNRISGPVDNLTGTALAKQDQVASVWGPDTKNYNRKPTGMLCVNGTLYLAVQNLRRTPDASGKAFTDAPSASISKSTDHGMTWTWDTKAPMFDNHQFTTIFFLDFGKNNANAIDKYVYAYGLDYNWHESDGSVPNPVDVYLARVIQDNIQNRPNWQFYAGADGSGNPQWTSSFDSRVAVLHDDRRSPRGNTVISQGGVVYDKPLDRFIYTSWGPTNTFWFYESPKPWGPWNLFLTKDFPETASSYGGYATTIPSKFISSDGKTMWVQSNLCIPCGTTVGNYAFSLRKLVVVPSITPLDSGATANTTSDSVGN